MDASLKVMMLLDNLLYDFLEWRITGPREKGIPFGYSLF